MEANADTQLTTLKKICPVEFELTDVLGSGGYGIVVKAKDKLIGRTVAIKFINSVDGDKEAQHKKFKQEGMALARLKHENIVSVLQMGIGKDDRPFIVYEYLEGRTLKKLLEEEKVLSPRLLSSIFEQVLAGLSHAHSMGVIHGDISPSNIILLNQTQGSTSGAARVKVKIVDFGLARIVEGEHDQNAMSTATNTTQTLRGNPFYMSPEQCRGEKADKRSDYYSMACVFYECLTGSPPFAGDTPLHILYKHLNEQPQLASDLPKSLKELLLQSLAKDKNQRFGNTAQFRSHLQRAIADLKKREPDRWRISKQFVLALIAACLLVTMCMMWFKNQSAEKEPSQISKSSHSEVKHKNISTGLRIKRAIVDFLHDDYTEPDECKNLLTLLDQELPKIKDKNLMFAAYSTRGRAEERLQLYQEAKDSYKRAYDCSLINGKETWHSSYPLLELALLSENFDKSKNKGDSEKRYVHIISSVEEGRRNENVGRLELDDDLEIMNGELVESIALCHLMYLTNDFKKYKSLGERAIAANMSDDGLAHASVPVMALAELHIARGHQKEGMALLNKLETAVKTEDCQDQIDRISAARMLASFYERRGNKKKAIEMAEFGIDFAKKTRREQNSHYTGLLETYKRLQQSSQNETQGK